MAYHVRASINHRGGRRADMMDTSGNLFEVCTRATPIGNGPGATSKDTTAAAKTTGRRKAGAIRDASMPSCQNVEVAQNVLGVGQQTKKTTCLTPRRVHHGNCNADPEWLDASGCRPSADPECTELAQRPLKRLQHHKLHNKPRREDAREPLGGQRRAVSTTNGPIWNAIARMQTGPPC